jgi:hypothetical protein
MLRFLGEYMRVAVDVSINATFMLTTIDSTFAGCYVSNMISVGNSRWGVRGSLFTLKLATCKVLVHMAILSCSTHS